MNGACVGSNVLASLPVHDASGMQRVAAFEGRLVTRQEP